MANNHGRYRQKGKPRGFRLLGYGFVLLALIFAFYVGCFISGAVMAAQSRKQAIQSYVIPASVAETLPPEAEQEDTPAAAPEETAEEAVEETEETAAPTEAPRFPTIDFQGLWEENEDVVAWIQVPAMEIINYPVVQGEDNAYYAAHTWNGEESENGAIFLDFQNEGDFSQVHNILYGHCMKDGSMFQELGDWEGPVYYGSHDRTILLYLPQETRVYEIFAVERVHALDSRVYKTDYTGDEEWVAALEKTLSAAEVKTQQTFTADAEVLTLSTCIGGFTRLVIHGVCLERVPT